MATKKQSDALRDPWFQEDDVAPDEPRLKPVRPPPRTRKERTTIAPLPKR
jgi:hypothetical protein